jgi:hypothetical protein
MDKKIEKIFYKELKIPCHINYIADRILKTTRQEAQFIINELIDKGVVEESCFAEKYYRQITNG